MIPEAIDPADDLGEGGGSFLGVLGVGIVTGIRAATGETVAATQPFSCRGEGGAVAAAVGVLPLVALTSEI